MSIASRSSALVLRLLPAVGLVPLLGADWAHAAGESFVEEFDGDSLDQRRWYVADGWANGPWQTCLWSKDRVSIADGALELLLTAEPAKDHDYTCASIQTKERFGHGVYEVRLRSAAAPGMLSAFFSYIGPYQDRTHEEIDFEFLGKSPESVQLNYFTDGKGDNEEHIPLPFDASDGFHDYAFEWAPDALRWYVEGELVHEVKADEGALPKAPALIHLMIWSGTNEGWLGRFEPDRLPLSMAVEHVAFTARGESCQFPESLVCRREALAHGPSSG